VNKLLAGKIVKPQGIRGEVKINSYVDNPEGFCNLKEVFIADKSYRIKKARALRNEAYLLLEGVDDRNVAETFRGQDVYIDKAQSKFLKKGDYFVDDLIGLKAFVGDKLIGKIVDILPNRSADIIVIEGEKNILAPFLNKAIKNLDLEKGVIVFKKMEFEEIACEN